MVVQHNIAGMNANRQLNITTGIQGKSSEKLSSGYRINRAADDAAGLAISEKMRRQIRGLTQASNNAQDGVSWCQIADGALNEVSDMLVRASDLAIKAANDTLQNTDRAYINSEVQRLGEEIDRIHGVTEFNNIHVFSDKGYSPSQAMLSPDDNKLAVTLSDGTNIEISFSFVDKSGAKADLDTEAKKIGQDTSYGSTQYAEFVKKAAADAVYNLGQNFPTLFKKAATQGIKIGLELSYEGIGNTLATANIRLTTTTNPESTVMSYYMWVDTADYPLDSFDSMTDDKKAALGATIAHEMTHLLMYDTLTDGMFGGYPDWFVEGVAQTSSGHIGWVSKYINSGSSDDQIGGYLRNLGGEGLGQYGAGYVAAMYLGYLASGASEVNSTNIKNGLNNLLGDMASPKKSLDQAIKDNTSFSGGLSAFEQAFGDTASTNFTRQLLQAMETNGAGSLFGALNETQSSLFAPNTLTSSKPNYYEIEPGNTLYANAFGTGYTIPEQQGGIFTGEGTNDGRGNTLFLQVGSETESMNQIALKRFNVRLGTLTEGGTYNTSTREEALETIATVKKAAQNVASVRSYYGALQNRLEHTVKNLDNVVENTQSSESRIRDTDMAAEMVKYSNNNILAQAGQAMLAQANQTNQGVLSLLQ